MHLVLLVCQSDRAHQIDNVRVSSVHMLAVFEPQFVCVYGDLFAQYVGLLSHPRGLRVRRWGTAVVNGLPPTVDLVKGCIVVET